MNLVHSCLDPKPKLKKASGKIKTAGKKKARQGDGHKHLEVIEQRQY